MPPIIFSYKISPVFPISKHVLTPYKYYDQSHFAYYTTIYCISQFFIHLLSKIVFTIPLSINVSNIGFRMITRIGPTKSPIIPIIL